MQIKKVMPLPVLQKKKLVAAYARVSTGKDAMLHSLSAQVSYYSEYMFGNLTLPSCGFRIVVAVHDFNVKFLNPAEQLNIVHANQPPCGTYYRTFFWNGINGWLNLKLTVS